MATLRQSLSNYLAELQRRGAAAHTVKSYGSDLEQFVEYFGLLREDIAAEEIDLEMLREWLGGLYDLQLTAATLRRKVAAVRSLFQFLRTEGSVAGNPAARLRVPKLRHTLPDVMSAEKANRLVDFAGETQSQITAHRERDTAILELLYGCGIRVGELVSINVPDFDGSTGWLRVTGKGNTQRQVPVGEKAVAAVSRYIEVRQPVSEDPALFLNTRGKRLNDRQVRRLVKTYALLAVGDSSVHPHSFRHAYATHLLNEGADLRAVQELLGHAKLSTTQIYTQVSLRDLQAVYDRAHPKA